MYRQISVFFLYMKISPLTPTMQTLFAELAQQVTTAPRAGTVYERERDGIRYYYAKIPVGADRIDQFVGRVGERGAEAEVESLRRGMASARERRRLVSILKKAGFARPYRVLGATLDAVSAAALFRNGAVLVGTVAYMMMEPLVGHHLPSPTLVTGDLDMAAADLALRSEPPENLNAILKRADPTFEPVLQLDPKRPPSRFRTSEGFLVDLVTPLFRREDTNPMPMQGLGAGAMPLHYMAWLIAEPVPTIALWGPGVPINVPQPARFAVHKLILAKKRDPGSRTKRQKDLAQADALIAALLIDDPYAIEDALVDACSRGQRGWATAINRSLSELKRGDLVQSR
jgi:hypothetical protein